MRGAAPSGDFLHRRSAPGVDLFLLPTRRFHTVTVRACLLQPLAEEPAAAMALTGAVLKQGTARHPRRPDLYGALDALHGAELEVDTLRIGEAHLLEAELTMPADRRTGNPRGLAEGLRLLGEVLAEPLREGRGLPPGRVRAERANLLDAIASLRDHRPTWAMIRCLRAVCASEPYRFGRCGSARALGAATPEGLWRFWARARSRLPMVLHAVGDFDPSALCGMAEEALLPMRSGKPMALPGGGFRRDSPARPLRRVERVRVAQARLCLAFRTNTAWHDAGFPALVLANAVLGGGSHGKLFHELRERHSLAYDASSSLERTKGLLLVSAGTAPAQARRAEDILLAQVAAVQAGRIGRDEWRDAHRTLVNRLRTMSDSPGRLIALHLEGWIHGAVRPAAEVLRAARAVRPGQAAEAARRWSHAATMVLGGCP